MKKSVLMLFLIMGFSIMAYSQASKGEYCMSNENKKSKFLLLTSFSSKVVTKNQKIEYSYVLTKRSKYRIQVCSDEIGQVRNRDVKIELFDFKRMLIASEDKKIFLDVTIEKSGVYYIQVSLKSEYIGRIISTINLVKLMNENSGKRN